MKEIVTHIAFRTIGLLLILFTKNFHGNAESFYLNNSSKVSTFFSSGIINLSNASIEPFEVLAGETQTQTYIVGGSGFAPGEIVTIEISDPAQPFLLSLDNQVFSLSVEIMALESGELDQMIAVRFAPLDQDPHYANINHSAVGAVTQSLSLEGNSEPLNLDLRFFNVKSVNENISLDWSIISKGHSYFDVEIMNDEEEGFQKIGRVVKKEGNDSLLIKYNFQYPLQEQTGTLYFRLKIGYESGKFDYSQVIAISNRETNLAKVQFAPNPIAASSKFIITATEADNINVRILNMNGNTIFKGPFSVREGINHFNPDILDSLPSGFYTAITEIKGKFHSIKLVKEY